MKQKVFERGDILVTAYANTKSRVGVGSPNVFVNFGEEPRDAEVTGVCEPGFATIADFELRWGGDARPDALELSKCDTYDELDRVYPELATLMREVEAWYLELSKKGLWK